MIRTTLLDSQTSMISSLDAIQNRIASEQAAISSGRSMQSAASDPAAFVQSLSLSAAISQEAVFSNNSDSLQTSLTQESQAVSSYSSLLVKAKTVAEGIVSLPASGTDVKAASIEISSIFDSIMSIANSSNSNGGYLFSGTSGSVPFVKSANGTVSYQGNSDSSSLPVSSTLSLKSGDPGNSVFSYGSQSVFSAFSAFLSDVSSNPTSAAATFQNSLDLAIANASAKQSEIAGRQNSAAFAQSSATESSLSYSTSLAAVSSTDYLKASSSLSSDITSYQAAIAAYGKIQGMSLFNYLP